MRRLAFRLTLILASLVVTAAIGEAALRVWYRDAGLRTLSGPGHLNFDHETIDGELRGPRDLAAKRAGVPRLMVIGDSITYGLGVRDWRQTWPELMVEELERNGRPHERAVFATPGHDMPQHLEVLHRWGARVDPDILIYQWYVNDVEAISHRPNATRSWQLARWHAPLRRSSYLYFSLDYFLAKVLPPPERSYADYLLSDFAPGTLEWTEFTRLFHEFAMHAKQLAPRRLLASYPQVPFRGAYPLQVIHDRMCTMAGPHTLAIPPAAWTRSGGDLLADATAPWKQAFSAPATGRAAIETGEYVFESGELTLAVSARATSDSTEPVAVFEVLESTGERLLATAPIHPPRESSTWQSVPITVTIAGNGLQRVRFRVRSTGQVGWMLADLGISVDYAFEVVDLTQRLNTFPTHASAFDAHPNEAAHRAMAEEIYAALVGRSGS